MIGHVTTMAPVMGAMLLSLACLSRPALAGGIGGFGGIGGIGHIGGIGGFHGVGHFGYGGFGGWHGGRAVGYGGFGHLAPPGIHHPAHAVSGWPYRYTGPSSFYQSGYSGYFFPGQGLPFRTDRRAGATPYLTNQTYEPGDGYRYPLYYNPATGSYFYYPVAR
jgi:hypothetical protein